MKEYFIYYSKKVFGPYDETPTEEQIEYMKKVFPVVSKSMPDSDHMFDNAVPPDGEVYILEGGKSE